MKTDEITNSADVIDSRDIIARIRELEDERAALADELKAAQEECDEPKEDDDDIEEDRKAKRDAAELALEEWDADNGDELKALKAMDDDAPGGDWAYGATLIRESYFEDYCRELVSDIGDLPHDIPGYLVIDWEKTADNLGADYSKVDFDGVTYLVR